MNTQRYVSTRSRSDAVSSAAAVVGGLAPDGGLYTPAVFPSLSQSDFEELSKLGYVERAAKILGLFFDDFTGDELLSFCRAAYAPPKFPENAAPVVKVTEGTYILELFHGPTCAFKDMALQLLPRLLTASMKKLGVDKTLCILVATSGDTGKAALEGFADVPDTKIMVFYPRVGVSEVQKLQMITQGGQNVGVMAVEGNFDDAQTGVKKIFTDVAVREALLERSIDLSSANSINWGRLAPQIVYYISAYCDLLSKKELAFGEKVNLCVPTGNFGNILAAYIAREMGLPAGKLICASNANNVLTDFIRTGRYDRNRPFYATTSPSMDILISSNVERLVFLLSGRNAEKTASYMSSLSETGAYELAEDMKAALAADFYGNWSDDKEAAAEISRYFNDFGYLADTHTAVALSVLEKYRAESGDAAKTIVASTASPYKFADSVLEALDGRPHESSLALLDELAARTKTVVPAPLASLRGKAPRFTEAAPKEDMPKVVKAFLA